MSWQPSGSSSGLVIGIINSKGGVGKTTTAIYLAAALTRVEGKEWSVEVWDADKQGSATSWALLASETEGLPFEVLSVNLPQIRKRVPTAQITIIDAPPSDESILNAIAERADLVIIPTSPAGADIERVLSTQQALPENTPAIVLLADADPRTILYRETLELLDEWQIAYFDQPIKPRQIIKAAYGTNPANLSGYEYVVEEMLEILEIGE